MRYKFIHVLFVTQVILSLFSITINTRECRAIENLPQWWTAEFEFNNPGARSRGIGGAFAAKADDSTAVVANPAGLAQLPGLQFYVEGRFSTWDTLEEPWSGKNQAQFEPVFNMFPPPFTTTRKAEIRNNDITELSFTCISRAFEIKEIGFNAAIFYNKIANNETEMSLPITIHPSPLAGAIQPSPGFNADMDLNISEYGLSIAKSFLKEKLMVGASLSVVHLDLESSFNATSKDSAGGEQGVLIPNALINEAADINDNDENLALRIGALYHITDNLTVGANVQLMPTLDYDVSYFNIIDGTIPANPINSIELESSITIPDVYSLGISYQIMPSLTISAEAKYIEYADLLREFNFNWGSAYYDFSVDTYDVDDIWESHLGMEYLTSVKEIPVAIRLGGYYEPAHGLEYDSPENSPVGIFPGVGDLFEGLMDGGEDILHFTGGAGVVLMNKVQIDVAADIQDNGKKSSFIISIAYQH